MPAGGEFADGAGQRRKRRDHAPPQHHGDAGKHAEQRHDGKAGQRQHRQRPVARGARAMSAASTSAASRTAKKACTAGTIVVAASSEPIPVIAVVAAGCHHFFKPWRGLSEIGLDRVVHRFRKTRALLQI